MTEDQLSILLISLVLILLFSLVFGHVFTMLGMPRVVGEISAGIILGPSLLGQINPIMFNKIFMGFEGQDLITSAFYWIGLILLMFTAGFQLKPRVSKENGVICALLIAGGIFLPFIFGIAVSEWIPNDRASNPLSFTLIIGAASAVTSIPVLTRIFIDLGLDSDVFAKNILLAAALQDVAVWFVVAIALGINASSVVEGSIDVYKIYYNCISIFFFVCFAFMVFPRVSKPLGILLFENSPETALVGYVLLACLFLVALASALKVQIVLAALIAGIVIGRRLSAKFEMARNNIRNISLWFFVPIYFALVGQKLNLIGSFDVFLVLFFLVGSSLVKIMSVVLMLRLVNLPWARALDYGITMNCRGGPGIALASVAYAAKIISEELFIAFVLSSIFTAIMAGSWLKFKRDRSYL